MTIQEMFSRMTWRANLMEAMIRKLGISAQMRHLPDHSAVLRRAGDRCLNCDRPDACQVWLASENSPKSAPHYCRNHDLFERVIAGMDADQKVSMPS